MDPPTPATTKQMKEKARKAAQKKAKKEAKKKAPSPYSSPNQSGSRSATPSASDVPLSYLSTFAASTTPTPPPSASAPVPAALLAEIEDDDKPGWQKSVDAAWAQGQKNICIRWVREKRAKLARAEAALAESTLAGRAAVDEEVEKAMMELSEEIDDAINRGCVMSELQ